MILFDMSRVSITILIKHISFNTTYKTLSIHIILQSFSFLSQLCKRIDDDTDSYILDDNQNHYEKQQIEYEPLIINT